MPRLPLVNPDDLDPADRAVLESLQIPAVGADLLRALAQRPAVMRQTVTLAQAIFAEGALPLDLKMLLAVRVAQVNHCVY